LGRARWWPGANIFCGKPGSQMGERRELKCRTDRERPRSGAQKKRYPGSLCARIKESSYSRTRKRFPLEEPRSQTGLSLDKNAESLPNILSWGWPLGGLMCCGKGQKNERVGAPGKKRKDKKRIGKSLLLGNQALGKIAVKRFFRPRATQGGSEENRHAAIPQRTSGHHP